jgi:hypothetical protein
MNESLHANQFPEFDTLSCSFAMNADSRIEVIEAVQ